MSLNVYIQPEAMLPRPADLANSIYSLDNDGCYCFLCDLFGKLAEETGQWIDLYGDAFFEGAALAALDRTLEEARLLVEAQPDYWEVIIGTRPGPPPEEVRETVTKPQMQTLLDSLGAAVTEARATGACVAFIGD